MTAVGWLTPICLALLIAVACGTRSASDSWERARREGTIRVGFANESPFAFRDPASGMLVGEAPAVARHVLGKLGIHEIEGVLTEFGSLIPGLKAGRFDLIAAGMYVTPERCRQVLFSEPSYCVHEALMVTQGNPFNLHSYVDLARSTAKLAVIAGTAELGYAKNAGIHETRIHVYPDAPSAVEALRSHLVDAFAATQLTIGDLLNKGQTPTLEAAEPFADPIVRGVSTFGCGAFAFRKDEGTFVDAFNRELTALLETPVHALLVTPFGFGPDTRAHVSRASLCGERER